MARHLRKRFDVFGAADHHSDLLRGQKTLQHSVHLLFPRAHLLGVVNAATLLHRVAPASFDSLGRVSALNDSTAGDLS